MVRVRQYEDRNVLEAAMDRLDKTLAGCDRIAVAFSGGKDSLALMHLVREAQQRAGDDRPVLAVFRDMEFVNPSVIEKVSEVFAREWVEGHWAAVHWRAHTTVAGTPLDFVTWDEARDHDRQPPPEAWRGEPGRLYSVNDLDQWTVQLSPGRVIIATGLRTVESLVRYRAVANKIVEPWLAKSKVPGVTMCRPIYDWLEADVLRYLWEHGDAPAAIYDAQVWDGKGDLRTASLMAVEQMRDLPTLRRTDPDAYARLLEVAPEVAVADRYDADLADRHMTGPPVQTWLELRAWIRRRYGASPTALARAMGRFDFARGLARKNPGGFPPWWVQHEIARDGHGTGMMPLPVDHPSRKARA